MFVNVILFYICEYFRSVLYFQVIELLIKAEEGLCREVIKHLNQIEEQILESMAWAEDSSLWDKIKDNKGKVPLCEEV